MENQDYYYPRSRKPNFKTWECPISGKKVNTRGVPAYIRNKFRLDYKYTYMRNPEQIIADYELKIAEELYMKTKAIIDEMDISGELKYDLIDVWFKIFKSIRKAVVEQDKGTLEYLNSILRQLSGEEEIPEKNGYNNLQIDEPSNGNQMRLF